MSKALEASKSHVAQLTDVAAARVRNTVATVGTRATDAAIRTALTIDSKLGVTSKASAVDEKYGLTTKATAAATSLGERFSLAERYAKALGKVQWHSHRCCILFEIVWIFLIFL